MSTRPLVLNIVALVLLVSTSGTRAILAGAPPDSPAARIDVNTTTSPWRGVVSVERGGNIYSGVLVGRRHVLTAAHVVDPASPPSAYHVNLNLSGATPQVIGVVRTTTHPNYTSLGIYDLALMQLDQDVPLEALVYPVASANPGLGMVLTLVGYGDSGSGSTGLSIGRSASAKRVGTNTFDYTSTNVDYYFDFDGPNASTNYLGGLTLGNATETTVAGGDSGGPAFAQLNGAWTVVGINAFVATFPGGPTTAGTFGTAGGGTLVAPARAWIDSTLVASGVEGNDIPLPAWAIALLAGALLAAPKRRRVL